MTSPDATVPDATAPTERVRIPVSGMTCAACQARVQRALQKSPGVADASVNLMMNSATVTFDCNKIDKIVRRAIEHAHRHESL